MSLRYRLGREFYLYCIRSSFFTLPVLRKLSASYQRRHLGLPKSTKLGLGVHFESAHRQGELRVGRKAEIGSGAYIEFSGSVTIGDNVTISAGAKVFTHNHDVAEAGDWRRRAPLYGGLEIRDGAWIGAHAIILPSVRVIGEGAVVGAGAVVTRDVAQNMIVAGNPAKPVRERK